MRQELAIGFDSAFPVATVHGFVVEAVGNLGVHKFIHVVTLLGQVHFHGGVVGDGGELVAREFVHAATSQQEEVFALLVGLNACPARIHLVEQLGAVLAQVHFP
ncbi:Uncharacterised protein [Chlamydia trachomatis]|nr:Uncharacterised protein [Chlamydia trachomatis]